MPEWLQILSNFDQVIVNEYTTGQGITPHIDCIPCFSDTICSLSLLKPCEMVLERDNINHSIILEPSSLLTFQDEARYEWRHSISQRKSNIKNRRVIVTYRKVVL